MAELESYRAIRALQARLDGCRRHHPDMPDVQEALADAYEALEDALQLAAPRYAPPRRTPELDTAAAKTAP